MYKTFFFMENQLSQIEATFNSLPPHQIIAHWVSGNKVNFLVRIDAEPEKPKRGRPARTAEVTHAAE